MYGGKRKSSFSKVETVADKLKKKCEIAIFQQYSSGLQHESTTSKCPNATEYSLLYFYLIIGSCSSVVITSRAPSSQILACRQYRDGLRDHRHNYCVFGYTKYVNFSVARLRIITRSHNFSIPFLSNYTFKSNDYLPRRCAY